MIKKKLKSEHWIMQFVLGPVPTYPDTFESATQFFFSDSKFSTSTLIRIQIEFARPNVSDTYPDSL